MAVRHIKTYLNSFKKMYTGVIYEKRKGIDPHELAHQARIVSFLHQPHTGRLQPTADSLLQHLHEGRTLEPPLGPEFKMHRPEVQSIKPKGSVTSSAAQPSGPAKSNATTSIAESKAPEKNLRFASPPPSVTIPPGISSLLSQQHPISVVPGIGRMLDASSHGWGEPASVAESSNKESGGPKWMHTIKEKVKQVPETIKAVLLPNNSHSVDEFLLRLRAHLYARQWTRIKHGKDSSQRCLYTVHNGFRT
ncbi:hypothetical protein DXG01_002783 [Tephrocybe rancida]|nr:hypothetical protein DXG01_002783 [Tephrocybe rancida]